jgi:galactokinase
MDQPFAALSQRFASRFGEAPAFLVRAPGRVNLIGEHTDYNQGFVLPLALEHSVRIALRPRRDRRVRLYSENFQQWVEFSLEKLEKAQGWGEYVKGVAWALQEEGYTLQGWEGLLESQVPIGAGLSSSAALEVAVARAFAAVSSLPWNGKRMALLCQKAENEWVGVQCGIMDQMISALAERGHALFLDCRTLETQQVPFPSLARIVVMDSGTRRTLSHSAYNERRQQCEEAARLLQVPALRDLSPQELDQRAARVRLDQVLYRRARHVVTENERVTRTVQALQAGDVAAVGALLNESHRSLDQDFEVTNQALNELVAVAWEHPACYGARMVGAGFGGCAIALVKEEATEAFMEFVRQAYAQRSGYRTELYPSHPEQGVECYSGMVDDRRSR